MRRNHLIIGSDISWLLASSVNHGLSVRDVLRRSWVDHLHDAVHRVSQSVPCAWNWIRSLAK